MTVAKLFEEMIEQAIEEANDSEKYAKLALKLKAEHPDIAKMYEEMSIDEHKHLTRLCETMSKVAVAKEQHHIPDDVVAVYNYLKNGMLHEQAILVKHLHTSYSGS